MGVTLGHRATWSILDTEQGWYTLHTLAGWAPKPSSSFCIVHHGHTRMHNPDLIPGTDGPAGCFLRLLRIQLLCMVPLTWSCSPSSQALLSPVASQESIPDLGPCPEGGSLVQHLHSTWTPQPNCRLIYLLLSRHGALGGDWQCPCHSHGCLHIV